jgi:PKD repeat protein
VFRPAALVAALALIGCSSRPGPELVAITPNWTAEGEAVDVVVDGANFKRAVVVDADLPSNSTVNDTFALALGDVPLEAVQYVDGVRLTGRVPATLAPGTYTLVLTDPFGRTATLADAFLVASPQQARLRIDDAAGGAGNEVGDVTVRVGQRVPMYAVGRLPNGAFSRDVVLASWAVSGVGTLSTATGPAVAWIATAAGSAIVTATGPTEGSDVTGTLTAVPCAQASDCADRCTPNASCVSGQCVQGPSTLDGDADGFIDALCPGGTDCDDTNFDVKPGASEGPEGDATCSDNADNDCDGQFDLAEPLCRPNAPPLARLTLAPQAVVLGTAVAGSSAGSSDVEDAAAALVFDWDWDGDGVYEQQGASTNHTFAAAGQHRVVLRVTDTRGATGDSTATALVVGAAGNLVTVTTGVDEANAGATPANPQGVGFSLREAVAWATATAGAQTIVIPSGTTVALTSQLDFTDSAGISLVGNGAVIDGTGIGGAGSSCLDLTGRLHRIDGVEVRGCPGLAIYTHGQDTTVTRCRVRNNAYGVKWAGSNDTFGPDNLVHDNANFGIDIDGTALVVGNVFRNIAGPAILASRGSDNSIVVGNLAWDSEYGIELGPQADNLKLWHNTLHANSKDGVRISSASNGNDLRNNIVTSSGGYGLDAMAISIATIGGNDLFQNASGGCRACGALGLGALSVAPGYLDAAGRDLRVYRSSPVVNVGLDTGADRNGPAPGNFNGAAPDVGAFEAP